MITFKPDAKAEIRVQCPHCEMINDVDLSFSYTDRPREFQKKCKRCLKMFSIRVFLVSMMNVFKDEN